MAAFSKIKCLLLDNYKLLTVLGAVIVLLTYLLNGIIWLAKADFSGDVICAIDDRTYEEFAGFIRQSHGKNIRDLFADSERLERHLESYNKSQGIESYDKSNIKFMESFAPYILDEAYIKEDDFLFVYIENQKSRGIKKVKIRIPSMWSVSNVKIISNALSPEEISKLQDTWSLNEDSRVLFFNDIAEMPSGSYLKIFIYGSGHPIIFDNTTLVTYDGGEAIEKWYKPEEWSLKRLAQYEQPSLELFLLISILVIIIYQTISNSQRD